MATAMVVGANRGIGLALVRRYAERGDSVIAVCRQSPPELERLGVRVESGVDVTRPDQLEALAKRVAGTRLDVLLCNAGVLSRESFGQLEGEALERIERQFAVNAIGPVLVVQALRRNLGKGSKVGLVTSRMGSIADNGSGGYYGYRMSKAALNAAGKSLAQDLQDKGIAVFLLHPGFVKTDMTDGQGDITPKVAAERLVQRLDELDISQTGSFWHSDGSPLPW